MIDSRYYLREDETLERPALELLQRRKLAAMLRVLGTNRFQSRRLAGIEFDPLLDPMDKLPFTTRRQLEQDQAEHPPYGSNLTFALERYIRLHQTSGTAGQPLRWVDTPENWAWWKRCWGMIFAAAGIGQQDRLVFTFSFGPFVGFWGAFESAAALGRFVMAGGGMSTTARLRYILDNRATVVCCTPTYALHMAQVAENEGLDLANSDVRALLVAGEPGGHIPATRQHIESAWGARLFDHTGMTEVGPLGFECEQDPDSVHLMENECIAEVIDPETTRPVPEGECGELVLTNLGRWGSPVIRYRTGDQVRLTHERCACGRWFARMRGGILGRVDDMFTVRGNNVFPGAVEAVVRRFPEIAEYALEVTDDGPLAQVHLKIEPAAAVHGTDGGGRELAERVGRAMQETLSFRAEIELMSPGSLPRFEMKAKRFTRTSRQHLRENAKL